MKIKSCRNRLLQALCSCMPMIMVSLAAHPAIANQGILRVQQGNTATFALTEGSGTNISFLEIDEQINQVWLDDPSWITLDANGCLMVGMGAEQSCQGRPARVLHLRQIAPLSLPGLPTAPETELTVITQASSGVEHIYVFEITHSNNQQVHSYHTVEVIPPPRAANTFNRVNITAVWLGFDIAAKQHWLEEGGMLYQRIQHFLDLAETKSAEVAAQEAGISTTLVARLEQLGQDSLPPAPDPSESILEASVDTPRLNPEDSATEAPAPEVPALSDAHSMGETLTHLETQPTEIQPAEIQQN